MFNLEMLLASIFCMLPYGIFWVVMLWNRTTGKINSPSIVENLVPVAGKEVFRKVLLIFLIIGPAIFLVTFLLTAYIAKTELSSYAEAALITFLLLLMIVGVIFNLRSKPIKK